MNLRKLSGIACLSLLSLAFSACGDDYEPMYLVSPTDTTVVLGGENQTLTLYPYSEGVSLYIMGGEGRYLIENSDETVASFRYDGRTLTILPEGVGTAVITITDQAGGEYKLTVQVNYVKATYQVVDVDALVSGEGMTQGAARQLADDIKAAMTVRVGGRYEFVYHDDACTEGIVTVYPTDGQSEARYGNFVQENRYTPDGQEYLSTTVHIGMDVYNFALMKNAQGEVTELRADVTERYQTSYPELESAYAVQQLELETAEEGLLE